MNRKIVFAALSALAPLTAFAQEAQAPKDPPFSLTIYSSADPARFDPKAFAAQREMQGAYARFNMPLPGYGVVREIRSIELKQGSNDIRFTDVAAGIDPTTVSFRSLTAPNDTSVLEQNFEYDLVSGDKLLQKYLDKSVVVTIRGAGNTGQTQQFGELLSADGSSLVLQNKEGTQVIARQDVVNISLTGDRGGLITKPTLVWKIDAAKAGKHDAQVSYQTDSLTWRADYNLVLNGDDTKSDVGAWVTIINESGATYPEAKLKLVAGDVQRISPTDADAPMVAEMRTMDKASRDTGFKEKSFFEYHLYTLGRTTTLPNRSTKQIELFEQKADVPIEKSFVYYGLAPAYRTFISPSPMNDRNFGTEMNKKVDVYLLLKNSEQNGMGIPLPAGRVRVSKKDDADGSLEFIGEDVIQHTAKDEQLLIKLGSAFDIVGERKQTDFSVDSGRKTITESFEIKIRNHKKEPAKVIIKENLFRWATWEITKNSEKFEKQDSRRIHIPVTVEPDGEKVVTYTVRYTW